MSAAQPQPRDVELGALAERKQRRRSLYSVSALVGSCLLEGGLKQTYVCEMQFEFWWCCRADHTL
jgi:hypothetical protein